MNDAALYQGYDRAGLDAQYNNRSRHPEHVQIGEANDADGVRVLAEFTHRLDVAYGPSEAETLDIYMPAGSDEGAAEDAAGRPVNVFIHGGYWYSRHKDDFRFMARSVVPAGGFSVVVNYALVPDVDLDELVRQCRAAVAWTYANAGDFGADPERVFVSGHSAGGHLTAMMAATDWPAFEGGLPADLVKGGTAISGVFDLTPVRQCYLHDILGLTEDQVRRLSPITLSPATSAPLVVAVGGAESDEFIRQSQAFAAAWGDIGIACELLTVPGANHFTVLDDAVAADGALRRAMLAQMGLA